MPVTGVAQKVDRSQVRHRNPTVADWIDVENIPFEGAPPLRDRQTGGVSVMDVGAANSEDWPQATLLWWRSLSRMPHCKLWGESEWSFAMDTAEIHARTMEGWRGYTGPSLTQREKQMGVTADFRRGLRIRYVEPKDKATAAEAAAAGEGADVIQMSGYRDL